MFKINSKGELVCRDSELKLIPKNLCENCTTVLSLDLRGNYITSIENSIIFKLTNLKTLDIRSNQIDSIPEEIGYLWNLKELKLDNNNLVTLPIQLFQLNSLGFLSVSKNYLSGLSDMVYKLRKLEYMSVSHNQIKQLPQTILKLSRLRRLYIQSNSFNSIPSGLLSLNLDELGLEWFDYISSAKKFKDLHKLPNSFTSSLITFSELLQIYGEDYEVCDVLYQAINRGDVGIISSLINSNVDLNIFDNEGYSPLVIAIKHDRFTIAKMLIDAGASFKYGAGSYGSVLHVAVYKCEIWLVEVLVQAGVDVDAIDAEGNTPLHILAGVFGKQKHKCCRIADMIMTKSPSPNCYNHENWTAAHIAARKGYSCAIKWIISQNKKLLAQNKETFNLNAKGGTLNWVPLHLASHSNHFKSVQLLVSAGAKVNKKNTEGKTPKDTSKGNIAVYKYLLRLETVGRSMKINNKETLAFTESNPDQVRYNSNDPLYCRYQALYSLHSKRLINEIKNKIAKDTQRVLADDALYLLNL